MRYKNISLQEMRDFLKIEKGWNESVQGKEVVFSYNLKSFPFIVIKVYSGIKMETGISRGCGQDAIRVCAVNTKTNQGWISTARVYRVEGWMENLHKRVLDCIDAAKIRLIKV